jgi:hypothetical protein
MWMNPFNSNPPLWSAKWKKRPFDTLSWSASRPKSYGHVNHAIYIDYIDTARDRSQENHIWTGNVKLAFFKQISMQVEQIKVHVEYTQGAEMISITSPDTVFALAELQNQKPSKSRESS